MTERQLILILHQLRSCQKECEGGKNYWHEAWQYEFHLGRKNEIENFVDAFLKTKNLTDLINKDCIINLNAIKHPSPPKQ